MQARLPLARLPDQRLGAMQGDIVWWRSTCIWHQLSFWVFIESKQLELAMSCLLLNIAYKKDLAP